MVADSKPTTARLRPRRPLADCTNSLPSPRLAAPLKPKPDSSSANFDASVGSNAAGSRVSSAVATSPAECPQIPAFIDDEESKRSSAQCRRIVKQKKQDRGKSVMVSTPMSCPPLGRTMYRGLAPSDGAHHEGRNTADTRNKMGSSKRALGDPGPSKASTSHPRSTKKRRHSINSFTLPQDFIEKQRAYFAEIDAYELVEEEVSASELE